MKQLAKFIMSKISYLLAITLATVVGGISTGIVMASIPDSSGNVNGCYRKNGGDFRVIDTAAESCANNENPINLSQAVNQTAGVQTAIFRLNSGPIDPNTNTHTGSVDTVSNRNITSYEYHDGTDNPNGIKGYCIKPSFNAGYMDATYVGGGSGYAPIFVKGDGTNTAEIACSSTYNILVTTGEEFPPLAVIFSK